jgi:bifunctional non-homologous end joining protein LigD
MRATLPEPMYATLGHALPRGAGWTYEPKYDGMRVLAEASSRRVRLMTRNGKDKRAQFPEVVTELRTFAKRAGRTVLTTRPRTERRERLDALFADFATDDPALALSDTSERGATMLARARRAGWEGIIAKRTDARYQPGARSDNWLKLKLQFRAEFVVGGFTEPRRTRPFLGALLLGAYDAAGQLVYVGHMGGGFDREGLRAMRARLEKLERRTPRFAAPRTNQPAHWVAPKLVVEVKFAEWTAEDNDAA